MGRGSASDELARTLSVTRPPYRAAVFQTRGESEGDGALALGRIPEMLSVRYPEGITSQSPMVARNELPWVNIPQQMAKPKKEGGHSCPPCRPAGRGQECPLSVVRLWEFGIENGCKVASYSPHSQHGRPGTQPPAGLFFLLHLYPR